MRRAIYSIRGLSLRMPFLIGGDVFRSVLVVGPSSSSDSPDGNFGDPPPHFPTHFYLGPIPPSPSTLSYRRSQSSDTLPALGRPRSTVTRSPLQSRAIYERQFISTDSAPTPVGFPVSRFGRPFALERLRVLAHLKPYPLLPHVFCVSIFINYDQRESRYRVDREIESSFLALNGPTRTPLTTCNIPTSPFSFLSSVILSLLVLPSSLLSVLILILMPCGMVVPKMIRLKG